MKAPSVKDKTYTNLSTVDIISLFLIGLYALVEFIPNFGSWDTNAPQWIYINIVNLLSLSYLYYNRKEVNIGVLFKNLPFITYLLFIAYIGVSIFGAINKFEGIFSYAKHLNTLVVITCLTLILNNRLYLFKYIARIVSVLLLVQIINVLLQFIAGKSGVQTLDEKIYQLVLNAGNKNILAASIAIKFPFLLYLIYTEPRIVKAISMIAGSLTIATIILISSRSSFIAVAFELLVFVGMLALKFRKSDSYKTALSIFLVLIVMLGIGYLISQKLFSTSNLKTGVYTKLEERITTISATDAGSTGRLELWHHALDYIQKNPLVGCGIGNWKLASIPYEKEINNEFVVDLNVHNDFLQFTTETGLIGGAVFIAVFLLIGWGLYKKWNSVSDEKNREYILFIMMLFGSYFIDAMINFPAERAIMQWNFALSFSLFLALTIIPSNDKVRIQSNPFYVGIGIILLGTILLHIVSYNSLVAQRVFSEDSMKAMPEKNFKDVENAFPSYPNITLYTIPINELKCRYLMKEKRFDEALDLLDKSATLNPALGFNDYLRATIYSKKGNLDSAFKYAVSAFDRRPRVKNNYIILNLIAVQRKDSVTINKIFNTAYQYKHDDWYLNEYLVALSSFNVDQKQLKHLTDSAIKTNHNTSKLLLQKSEELNNVQKATAQIEAATNLFDQKKYKLAIPEYKKATVSNPSDYASYENIGICYFYLGDFKQAIEWLEKGLTYRKVLNGKSEYVLGLSYINTDNKQKGCYFLQQAATYQFPDAENRLRMYCK